MAVLERLKALYWHLREQWTLAGIYNAHRAAGHPNPMFAAHQELHVRGEYLERFRDEASEAYLRDGTDLDQFKKDFIKDNLSHKTTILDTLTTAAVRAAIREMPAHEAYHKAVYEKYLNDLQQWGSETMAEAEAMFGKGGFSPLQRRVLRGRN